MQNPQLFMTRRITCWVKEQGFVRTWFSRPVTWSSSSAAPNWSWELCRMLMGNALFMTSTHQPLETHGSLEVTLWLCVGNNFSRWYQKPLPKRIPLSVQQQHRFLQISPSSAHSFRCQIQQQIIKLPPNKRRLAKGCGCFMWFLLNEGDTFTAKPSTIGLAAKIPTLQMKAPTTGQSAKMKIRLVLQENLFLWPEVSFSQPQVFTETSHLRPAFIFSSVHRSYHYQSSDTCKTNPKKFPPNQQHLADTKGGK